MDTIQSKNQHLLFKFSITWFRSAMQRLLRIQAKYSEILKTINIADTTWMLRTSSIPSQGSYCYIRGPHPLLSSCPDIAGSVWLRMWKLTEENANASQCRLYIVRDCKQAGWIEVLDRCAHSNGSRRFIWTERKLICLPEELPRFRRCKYRKWELVSGGLLSWFHTVYGSEHLYLIT